MNRCEDFPCCGHTFDDPCAGSGYDPYTDPHVLCDHLNNYCEQAIDEPEYEDEWAEVDSERRQDAYDNSRY